MAPPAPRTDNLVPKVLPFLVATLALAACGVRAPPKPPLTDREVASAQAPKASDALTTETPTISPNDLSGGGMSGVEHCEACELHERDLVN